jgi:hypothetical protein
MPEVDVRYDFGDFSPTIAFRPIGPVDKIETQFKVIVLEQKLNLNTGEYERKAIELNFTNAKRPIITGGISAQMPEFLNGIVPKRYINAVLTDKTSAILLANIDGKHKACKTRHNITDVILFL